MRNKKLNAKPLILILVSFYLLIGGSSCKTGIVQNAVSRNFITVPFILDHNDANLPSTLLKNYQVVFDYSRNELTLAQPGSIIPVGIP